MLWMNKKVLGMLLWLGFLSAQTTVAVQPGIIANRNLIPGDTFWVNVYIENVTGLYSYQFLLQYKPDVLTAVSYSKGGFLQQGGTTILTGSNRRRSGSLLAAESFQGTASPVSGSGVLVKILFRVNKRGKTYLDLAYTRDAKIDLKINDYSGYPIGCAVLNGEFSNE